MKATKRVWTLCSVLGVLAVAGNANAQTYLVTDEDQQVCYIGYPRTGDNSQTGDNTYQSRWRGDQGWVNFLWYGFNFNVSDWDQGFGYENVDDCDRPLCRTISALYALYTSDPVPVTSTSDYSGSVLHWGGNFANSRIDELDARCPHPPHEALTQWGPIIDNWTQLYPGFFYDDYVVERAAIIMHESRHADWYGHNADPYCPRGSSCDSNWDYQGANTFYVGYLWWYWYQAVYAPAGSKLIAKLMANIELAIGYQTRPPWYITCGSPEEPC